MAPSVDLMTWATPGFPLPAWVSLAHWTVVPLPRLHEEGAAFLRYSVKFWVVPDESERWTTTMLVLGRLADGLSALMAGSSQVLICRLKILASVSGDSARLVTPERLYETVIGATTVGK